MKKLYVYLILIITIIFIGLFYLGFKKSRDNINISNLSSEKNTGTVIEYDQRNTAIRDYFKYFEKNDYKESEFDNKNIDKSDVVSKDITSYFGETVSDIINKKEKVSSFIKGETIYAGETPEGFDPGIKENGTITITNIEDKKETYKIEYRYDEVPYNKIYNLIPNNTYKWEFENKQGQNKQSGYIKPTETLRMIKMKKTHNFRDLGGWQADGGTTKYAKIYRGARIYGDGTHTEKETINSYDKNVLQNILKVTHEVDLRKGVKENETIEAQNAGIVKNYTNISCSAYNVTYANNIKALKNIIETINKSDDNVIYFHCAAGADRTGTIAYMLEGLLGVSQSDLDKDYELTNFYTYGNRNNSISKS